MSDRIDVEKKDKQLSLTTNMGKEDNKVFMYIKSKKSNR